jgi:hypothetical protein
LENITTLVLAVFTFNFQVSQYKYIALRADCKNDISETLHLEFCKYIMKVKKCTPNYIVYGELGRVPMSVHINARMIGFWARIVNGKKEKISRTLYDILYQLDLCDVYHSKWFNIRIIKVLLNFLR